MFSVLLSCYHSETPLYLRQALESIWDEQTKKPDQIVLVLDGPLTPNLNAIIEGWQKRLPNVFTSVSLAQNVGLGAALNEGLKHCHYDLVARMDTDDVALPKRFAKQVVFMRNHPDVAACSAQLEEWDCDLIKKLGERKLPCEPISLAKFAKCRSPLSHPLVMFRKQAVEAVGGYPPLRNGQDYGLWSLLLARGYKLANLPDVLLKMRAGTAFLRRRGWPYFIYEFQLLQFQHRVGYLNYFEFFANVLRRGILRLAPTFLKRFAYRVLR